jgi:Rieske Fe-S protein
MDESRRTVLAAAAGLGALCACSVAGCATYGASQGANAPAGGPGQAGGSGAGAGAGAGQPLAKTSDIPVGGGIVLADKQVVLTQPAAGVVKAFTAICTHAGCTVSSVSGGTINCPCHGSRFHIADGSVANGPAQQPLAAISIQVAGGSVTLG